MGVQDSRVVFLTTMNDSDLNISAVYLGKAQLCRQEIPP